MSSRVLLLLCTGFVVWLLRLDRKQSAETSSALWVPTLWMLICASRPLSVWLGLGGGAEGSPLDQVVLSLLYIIGIVMVFQRGVDLAAVIRNNFGLLALVGCTLASVLWSDMPVVSFKRWIREVGVVSMALVVMSDPAPRQAMLCILRRTVYVLIPYSVLLVKYYPHLGVNYNWIGDTLWTGVTFQKNSLGRLCLVSAFFFIWTWVSRRDGTQPKATRGQKYAEAIVFLMTAWLMKGPGLKGYSATGVVSLTAGLCLFVVLRRLQGTLSPMMKGQLFVLMLVPMAIGITLPLVVGGSSLATLSSALGRDATLTGRTDIWASLVPDFERAPLFGIGFASFWTTEAISAHDIGEAHNGYLEVLLDRGLVGIVFLVLFLIGCYRKTLRGLTMDLAWSSLVLCFIFMALVHNVTESSINSLTTHLTGVLVFLTVSLEAVVEGRRKREQDQDIQEADMPQKLTNFGGGPTPAGPPQGAAVVEQLNELGKS